MGKPGRLRQQELVHELTRPVRQVVLANVNAYVVTICARSFAEERRIVTTTYVKQREVGLLPMQESLLTPSLGKSADYVRYVGKSRMLLQTVYKHMVHGSYTNLL
jgi:hypothetical protein